MTEEESKVKCDAIRQIAYELHVYLGTGYLEKVYENGLAHRLSKAGFNVKTQVPIKVCDEDGYVIGDYIVDMLVDGIVIELKAVSALQNAHIAQTINYLSAMKIDYGMLINFGSPKFESRKLARPRLPTSEPPALCGRNQASTRSRCVRAYCRRVSPSNINNRHIAHSAEISRVFIVRDSIDKSDLDNPSILCRTSKVYKPDLDPAH